MFEVGNIVKWEDGIKEHIIPKYRSLRWEIISVIDDNTVSIKALSSTDLIKFKSSVLQLVRDIEYERSLKMSKFIKNKKWWHRLKRK